MNYSNIGAYNNIVFSFLNEQMDVLNPTPQEKKFIDLLIEYLQEVYSKITPPHNLSLDNLDGKRALWVHETVIISKNFKFIEWLVVNDYIDIGKLIFADFIPYYKNRYEGYQIYDDIDGLLMILQIQPEPIDFLIKCLK